MGHGSTTRASVKGQCFSCNVSWLLTSVLHVSFFTVSRWSDGWHTNTINFIWAALALHTFLRQFSCESGGPDMSWEETEQQWMNFLSQRWCASVTRWLPLPRTRADQLQSASSCLRSKGFQVPMERRRDCSWPLPPWTQIVWDTSIWQRDAVHLEQKTRTLRNSFSIRRACQ